MRTIFRIFSALLVAAIVFSGQSSVSAAAPAKSVALQFPSVAKKVTVGSKLTLKVAAKTKVKIQYTSDKPAVAAVDGNGTVTGKSAGAATITAAVVQKGYSGKASVKVEVVPKPAPKPTLNETYIPPTTDANMGHGSYVVQDDTYLYYIAIKDSWDGGPIYREKKGEPSTRKQLFKGNAMYLAKQGDWLFFSNQSDEEALYKIKTDGTGAKKLSGEGYWGALPARTIAVAGNWVYYGYYGQVNRVLTDGTKAQTVFEDAQMMNFWLSQGTIYYVFRQQDGKSGIKKAKLGDKTGKLVAYADTYQLEGVSGDWIYYYLRGEDGTILYRIKSDGTQKTKVAKGYDAILSGDWVYSVDFSVDAFSMLRSKADGSGAAERIMSVEAYSFSSGTNPIVVGDRIYYLDAFIPGIVYDISSGGGDRRRLGGGPVYAKTMEQLIDARERGIAYIFDKSDEDMPKMEAALTKAYEAIGQIIQPDMSDDQKLKAVHDYIVLNTAYDYDNYLKNTIPMDSYSEYGVLVKGTAVCQGYALTLQLFMDLLGIENYYVSGIANGGGHAWNVVRIDGKYYQVDATWDDPVPDQVGRLRYDYYKVTDDFMSQSRTWDRSQAPAAN